ncbi:MAG TPA: DUF3224 domain-containing protein [Opitutaceae bacterium]|nr:DUF3224 domain-containing protein [Opitutaceae bacterium]
MSETKLLSCHTYPARSRGFECFLGIYNFLDNSPKNRDEEALPFPVAWMQRHDRYHTETNAPAIFEDVDMNKLPYIIGIGLCLVSAPCGFCQTPSPNPNYQTAPDMIHAKGTFEVKMTPAGVTQAETIGRFSIDKKLHGDLEAVSKGEMLSTGDPALGNGAYVAIERITGTLSGRTGTFALVHFASLTGGRPKMNITVAPGSGTGQLKDISGTFNIIIAEGKHSYTFEYTLPDGK